MQLQQSIDGGDSIDREKICIKKDSIGMLIKGT